MRQGGGLSITLISIHALTRSATNVFVLLSYLTTNFNPRTHEECDLSQTRQVVGVILISIHALTRSATI